MYKIGILTPDLKEDFHSAELFEQASQRAQAYLIQPKNLKLEINRNTPIISSASLNIYDLDALIIRRLDQHGDSDFQFDLLCQLQQSGVVLFNSCQSLQVTESKALTSYLLSLYGFPVIDSLVTQKVNEALDFASRYSDVVIKPLYGQLGQDVYKLSELKEPANVIEMLIEKSGSVFVQRFIESDGKDLRVFVVDDRVVASIERQSTTGWKSNISQGAKAKKFTLSKELRDMAVKVSQIIGLDYCGIDIIVENEKPYILELNGSPAWQGVKSTTGKDVASEIISAIIKKLGRKLPLYSS